MRSHYFSFLRRSDGTRDLAVNGSQVPQVFSFTPPPGPAVNVARILWKLRDKKIDITKPLGTNGITVQLLDESGGVVIDFLDGEAIQSLDDFSLLAGIDHTMEHEDSWHCRWTLAKSGQPVKLFQNQRIAVTIRDDLSDFVHFYAMAQGTQVT